MRHTWLFALALFVSGCSIIPDSPGPTTYFVLEAPQCGSKPATKAADLRLLLTPMTAGARLNSQRMLFSRDSLSRGSYQLAMWNETPPNRLSTLLLNRFECDGLFRSVTMRSLSTAADLALHSELLEFYHDLSVTPSEVDIEARVELVHLDNRVIVAAERFQKRVPVELENAQGAAAAFNAGSAALTEEIAAWVRKKLSAE